MNVLLDNVRVQPGAPGIYWYLSYEARRSGADMQYRFWWRLRLGSSGSWYYNNCRMQIILNNSIIWTHNIDDHNKGWDHSGTTGWYTVSNKTSGTTPCYSTVLDTQNSSQMNYTSGTFNLYVAPAYTSITSFSVAKRDETSVTISYATAHTVDNVWASNNNGATWFDLASDNIITGLTAGTGYNFKIRVRRQDSQLTTDSSAVYQETYPYPSINSQPDFTIGDNLRIGIDNPLNRSVSIYINNWNNTQLFNGSSDGGYIDFDTSTTTRKNALYNSIPTTTNGRYKTRLVYGNRDHTIDGSTFYVKGGNTEAPNFESFDWVDIDPIVSKLTGMSEVQNPTILVSGLSDVMFNIPTTKKATSSFGASLKSYTFEWNGGASTTKDYSSSSNVSSNVYDGSDNKLIVTAQDYRGQTTKVTKGDLIIITPTPANASLTTTRRNGIESTTYLNGNITYWNGGWAGENNRTNTLLAIQMKVNNDGVIDITQDILNNSTISNIGDIQKITIDNDVVEIHELASKTGGFQIGKSYTLQFMITTGVDVHTLYENNHVIGTTNVTDGKIGMARYKDQNGNYHYGINGMPSSEHTLIVHGSVKLSDISIDSLTTTTINTTNMGVEQLTVLNTLWYKNKPVPLKNLHNIDLSSYSSDNWFPIVIDTIENGPPIHVELSSQSFGGSDPYNSNRLVGYVSGNGWADRGEFYDLIATRFDPSECTIGAVMYGTKTFMGVIIYVRGGRSYDLITRGYVYIVTVNNSRLPNDENGTTLSANTNTITTNNTITALDFRNKTFTSLKCISGDIENNNAKIGNIYIQTQMPMSGKAGDIWFS